MKVLTVFSLSPGSKFLRKEVKDKINLNNVNLDNVINVLLNSDLIKKEKRFLYFNLENKEILGLVQEEYKKLKELPLEVYFSIVDLIFILSKFKGLDVYLFGSYSKLIFKEDSDIDIAIISEGIDKKNIIPLTSKIESRYNKKIEIHYFGKNFYSNKKDPLINDILRNGVKLI